MSIFVHIVLLLLTAGASITILLFSMRRRTEPGSISLIVFALVLIIWVTTYTLFLIGILPSGSLSLSVIFLCATVTSTALFTFALEYTNRGHLLTRFSIILLASEPVFTLFLLWTDRYHSLFFTGNGLETRTISTLGQWIWIDAIYSNSLIAVAILLLIQAFIRRPRQYRPQSGTILVGMIAPILIRVISIIHSYSIHGLNFSPITFTITGLAFTYGLFVFRRLNLVTVPREMVVENLSDGWIVLDTQNRFVDLNPAAETLIGLTRHTLYGLSAEEIMSDWLNEIKFSVNIMEMDIKRSVKVQNDWRYLHIRSSPLANRSGHNIGRVLVMRDITEQKMAEEARQQSHDQLISLLRGISNAASQTLNLEDFLTASIHQIVHSFQSQSGVVFLLDEQSGESGMRRLVLASHDGLSAQDVKDMSSIPMTNSLVASILEYLEPQMIPDIISDPRVPATIQQLGHAALLMAPLVVEDDVLGMIGLVRKIGSNYRKEDIAKIKLISEEVATFIQGDRQRQSMIALAERQRLVRDLHDSISHNLYGVVALTEAAQAGLEAKSTENQAKVLSRIGETARLAVKEMRLFLHELQPANLQKEGLVQVLHRRLEAVEGRSDIKALLITNYNGCLPLKKEVTLYYTVQEALNNVLRHSHAKSVTVRLKQKRENVILEIEDFGCGFDPTNISNEGMGLRNMRERASLIGSTFKIISAPGNGTKIIVNVQRDRQ